MTAETAPQDGTQAAFDWQTYPDLSLPPILAAALADFQQHGYHGTTVRGIAAGVGLTMPTLYYHYGNKEGILFALLDIALDDALTHIELCIDDAGVDPLKRFENFIATIASHYTYRRDLAMLHDESRFLGAELRMRYLVRRNLVQETLEGLLEAGVAEGIFDCEDLNFTARVLLGMLAGILDWYSKEGSLAAAEIAHRYTAHAVRLVSKAAAAEVSRRRRST